MKFRGVVSLASWGDRNLWPFELLFTCCRGLPNLPGLGSVVVVGSGVVVGSVVVVVVGSGVVVSGVVSGPGVGFMGPSGGHSSGPCLWCKMVFFITSTSLCSCVSAVMTSSDSALMTSRCNSISWSLRAQLRSISCFAALCDDDVWVTARTHRLNCTSVISSDISTLCASSTQTATLKQFQKHKLNCSTRSMPKIFLDLLEILGFIVFSNLTFIHLWWTALHYISIP